MNMQELKQLIYKGEKIDVECKTANFKMPKAVYESYSAFANTKGGYIILGVEEDKTKKISEERYILQGVRNAKSKWKIFGIRLMGIRST